MRNLLFLLMLCFGFFVVGQHKGTTYQSAKNSKQADFVYVYDGTEGLVQGEGQNVKGLLVEVMRKFEEHVQQTDGISVTSEFRLQKDFKQFMSEIKMSEGGIFGLSNVSITEERKKNYQFSPSYMSNISVLVTNNATPSLSALNAISTDFAGKTAYAVGGSTYYTRLASIKANHFPDMKIIELASTDEVVEKVINDDNSFTVVDLVYYMANRTNTSFRRHAVGDNADDMLGIIMPLKNDWASAFEKFFLTFKKSDDYRNIVIEHMGKGALRMID
ncbi:MAG: transporter substrate-binding domain-containing protein [Cyclobacteriaceae bacterium]